VLQLNIRCKHSQTAKSEHCE